MVRRGYYTINGGNAVPGLTPTTWPGPVIIHPSSPLQALRAALPIYVVFLATIAFAIYFPSVVLWLPQHVLPESVGCFKSPAGTGYICPK